MEVEPCGGVIVSMVIGIFVRWCLYDISWLNCVRVASSMEDTAIDLDVIVTSANMGGVIGARPAN